MIPDLLAQFEEEKRRNAAAQAKDPRLHEIARAFMEETGPYRYTYNFTWLGLPVIQFPQDLVAMQEIIWRTGPDLIIETGIAHGGSLVFYASMLELLGRGEVVGIDVEIREHNRQRILAHPLSQRIRMVQGSSVSDDVVEQVFQIARDKRRVLVALDSWHTHEHVLRELQLYSPLVTRDNYLVVFDTSIEDAPQGFFAGKPWDRGNNPKTAVREFLATNHRFVIDTEIENKLLITVASEGFLKCVQDP